MEANSKELEIAITAAQKGAEEAGGTITRIDGSPITKEGTGYISTNGLLHDAVINIVNERK